MRYGKKKCDVSGLEEATLLMHNRYVAVFCQPLQLIVKGKNKIWTRDESKKSVVHRREQDCVLHRSTVHFDIFKCSVSSPHPSI